MPDYNEEKLRLDLLLMRRTGYGREFIRELIENSVLVNGREVNKPGMKVSPDAEVIFNLPDEIYVSRGGYKLAYALKIFEIDLTGKTCLDAGASTGGFTECMLQNGAALVYAVDIGTNQLSESLRENARVAVMENTDIRNISSEILQSVDFFAADLSFISLTKILPHIAAFLTDAILLVKPQFEAGRGKVSKRGVIKDKKLHSKIMNEIYKCCEENGLTPMAHVESPITGRAGNIEYLLRVIRDGI